MGAEYGRHYGAGTGGIYTFVILYGAICIFNLGRDYLDDHTKHNHYHHLSLLQLPSVITCRISSLYVAY